MMTFLWPSEKIPFDRHGKSYSNRRFSESGQNRFLQPNTQKAVNPIVLSASRASFRAAERYVRHECVPLSPSLPDQSFSVSSLDGRPGYRAKSAQPPTVVSHSIILVHFNGVLLCAKAPARGNSGDNSAHQQSEFHMRRVWPSDFGRQSGIENKRSPVF
jgi:hypothetical protein